jgi:hypothetical protein
MLRFGRTYRVVLDCGHTMTRTKDEIKIQQLYVEKQVGCPTCAQEKK